MSINSEDPIDQLLTLLEHPKVKAFLDKMIDKAAEKKIEESYKNPKFKAAVEETILTSECRPIQRISKLEEITGLVDFSDFEEEDHEPTLPEKINLLSEKIANLTVSPQNELPQEVKVTPRTSLESKAVKLVEKLKVKPRSRTGEVFMDNSELTTFLKTELPDELRSNDTNLRRVKKRVIEKARSLFPESIRVNKSKYGRHETRVVFKISPENVPMHRNGTLNLNLS